MSRERAKTPERVVELLNKAVKETSQSAVAREAGITQPAVHRYMKGIGEPSQATLEKLAAYFGVSVPWLRGYDLPRWIPCAEQLPNDNSIVLLATKTSQPVRPGYCTESHWWTIYGWYIPDGQVTHWQPLPDPPEVQP